MDPGASDDSRTLDTSAVITAFEPTRRGYAAMQQLIAQWTYVQTNALGGNWTTDRSRKGDFPDTRARGM